MYPEASGFRPEGKPHGGGRGRAGRDKLFSRLGIGARLFIAFLGIAALSLSSGVAGWWILRDVSQAQSRITEEALPAVAAAQATGDATTRILAAGQSLAASPDEVTRVRHAEEINALAADIRRDLADAALSKLDYPLLTQLSSNAETLIANLGEQNRLVTTRLQLLQGFERRAESTLAAATNLVDLSETLVSNASAGASAVVAGLYGLIDAEGTRTAAYDALDRLIEQDIYLLDRMWELRLRASQLALLTNRLSRAVTREEVLALSDEFASNLRIVKRRVAGIDDPIRRSQAEEQLLALRSAVGEMKVNSSLFEDRLRLIAIGEELDKAAESNRLLSGKLTDVAQTVVSNARGFALAASAQANRAVSAGLLALLATTAFAVLISGLIVWLYVERGVVRRLQELAQAMRRLTIGDLAVEVKQGGTHELKDLAEAVTAFRDVSRQRGALEAERERTNEELRRHREELRELVAERTTQLEHEVKSHAAAREAAERASRAKSDFLATMSHEIRTPMTGMLGMLRLLQGGAPGPEQAHRLATASASGEALLGILNSILDYSKIESGKITVDPVVFRLDETLAGIVALMRPSAEEKGLALELAMEGGVAGWFEGDAGKIRQILFNLVSNAIKFTPSGKVCLRAVAQPAGDGRHHVAVAVTDTGIGIPEAKRQSIFESFTQTDSSITRRYGGTGLGLSISRGLAQALGGTLEVESGPGRGSTFTLALLLDDAEAPAVAGVHEAKVTPGASHTVLVVEDDEATREVAVHFIAALGHRCHVARDGYEALALAQELQPDVVLMDISLPGLDGLSTARLIREVLAPSPIRFIAMSAHVFAQEVETYLASGMVSYVAKPLTPEALAAAIVQAMGTPTAVAAIDDATWQADLASLGPEQMRKIVAIAAKTLPDRAAELQDALSTGDVMRLASSAHAGFSAASAAGFTGLQQLFSDVESTARRGDAEGCRAPIEALADLIAATLVEADLRLAASETRPRPGRAEPRRDSPLRVT